MRECEKRRVMMFMWSLRIKRDFGTSWEGELGERGYIIMDEHVFKIFSNQQHLWRMEVGSLRSGDGNCSNGGFHQCCYWRRMVQIKYMYLGLLLDRGWCTTKLLDGLNYESKGEDNGRKKSWGALLSSQHFGGRGACWSFEMGLVGLTSNSITHADMHKPTNKLVSA